MLLSLLKSNSRIISLNVFDASNSHFLLITLLILAYQTGRCKKIIRNQSLYNIDFYVFFAYKDKWKIAEMRYSYLYSFISRRSTKSRGPSSIWASWAKLLYLCFNKWNRQRLRWSSSGSMDESDSGLQSKFNLCKKWFVAKHNNRSKNFAAKQMKMQIIRYISLNRHR